MSAAAEPMRSMEAQSPQLSTDILVDVSSGNFEGEGTIPPGVSVCGPPGPDVIPSPVAQVEVDLALA